MEPCARMLETVMEKLFDLSLSLSACRSRRGTFIFSTHQGLPTSDYTNELCTLSSGRDYALKPFIRGQAPISRLDNGIFRIERRLQCRWDANSRTGHAVTICSSTTAFESFCWNSIKGDVLPPNMPTVSEACSPSLLFLFSSPPSHLGSHGHGFVFPVLCHLFKVPSNV